MRKPDDAESTISLRCKRCGAQPPRYDPPSVSADTVVLYTAHFTLAESQARMAHVNLCPACEALLSFELGDPIEHRCTLCGEPAPREKLNDFTISAMTLDPMEHDRNVVDRDYRLCDPCFKLARSKLVSKSAC